MPEKPKREKKPKEGRPPLAPALPGSYRVEVRPAAGGRKRVLVCACGEIRAYSRERVAFRHGKECVTVSGCDLWCKTYGNRTAEVVGRVSSVRFGDGEEGDA